MDFYLTADYEEFKPETFKAFKVTSKDKTIEVVFHEGASPAESFRGYQRWLQSMGKGLKAKVFMLSTVDNFLMDSKNEELKKLVYPKRN
jgi:hypothetical protein